MLYQNCAISLVKLMEETMSSLAVALLAVLLTTVIGIIIFANRHDGSNSSTGRQQRQLPPGKFGWPIIGEAVDILFKHPEKFVRERMDRYSADIFKNMVLGQKMAVICGASGHKFLFSNDQKLFTSFFPPSAQKLFLSSAASSSPTDKDLKLVRGPGFLKPEALVHYLEDMDSIVRQKLKIHWEGKDEVKVHPFCRALTLTLACRFFLGIANPERIAKLLPHFDDISSGVHSVFPLNIPGTAFYYANKAAAVVRRELASLIKEKAAAAAAEATETAAPPRRDLLSQMIGSEWYVSQVDIADKMMGLLVAGYATIANTMTYFIKYVGERPDIYDKVLSEQMEISSGGQALLSWNDMQKMKYSWAVVCEVMRLTPPVQGNLREALADFTYAGYTVPKGWKVYWSLSTTNGNGDHFPEPEKFDPSRFEGDGVAPYVYVPFGAGPRMCPGKEYARLVILTFVHNVVTKFKWETVFPGEKNLGNMMPIPEKGLPIYLHPLVK